MVTARKLSAVVQAGGRIELSAPDLPVGEEVEVIIRVPVNGVRGGRSAVDILAECPGGVLFKSPEDVDAYVREERDAWGP